MKKDEQYRKTMAALASEEREEWANRVTQTSIGSMLVYFAHQMWPGRAVEVNLKEGTFRLP